MGSSLSLRSVRGNREKLSDVVTISQEWLQGKGTAVFKEAFWSWGEWLLPFATKGLGRWGGGMLPRQSDSTAAAILKGREERHSVIPKEEVCWVPPFQVQGHSQILPLVTWRPL